MDHGIHERALGVVLTGKRGVILTGTEGEAMRREGITMRT
jgi:hypothetical protein